MIRQELNVKLQQKLSPLQIQVIKMLEYPAIEMEERIREEMEANPALEEGRDKEEEENNDEYSNSEEDRGDEKVDLEEYAIDDDIPDYRLNINNYSPDEQPDSVPFSAGISFHEHLLAQLELSTTNSTIRHLAEYLVGNIDEDGYLRRSIEMMVDDLAFQVGITVPDSDMYKALEIVQDLEPAGVGARSLQECLMLQLDRKKSTNSIEHAKRIITSFFDQFSKKQFDVIGRRIGVEETELKLAIAEILKLNPKPGNAFANGSESLMERITPDFVVENDNGKLTITLNNSNIPELRVSQNYSNMVQDFMGNKTNQSREMKDAILFAKQKIDAARWFIDAIKQRNATLMKTMNAILCEQYNFFLSGDDSQLRPMRLRDIADKVGFDISTISRVSNSKYVQTEFGVFPLKYFFSETMMTNQGEEVSNKEIKQIIVQVIQEEDKAQPIADDALTDILKEKGYIIARRTVAKYREQLNIPVARLRKKRI